MGSKRGLLWPQSFKVNHSPNPPSLSLPLCVCVFRQSLIHEVVAEARRLKKHSLIAKLEQYVAALK